MNTLFKCSNCGSFDICLDAIIENKALLKPISLVCRECLYYEVIEE